MLLGESCCDFGEFYEDEGLMPPVHECPREAPLSDELGAPMTDLEHELARSLDFALGVSAGRVIDCRRRWR